MFAVAVAVAVVVVVVGGGDGGGDVGACAFFVHYFFFGNIRTGNNLSAIRDDVSTLLHVLYVCVPRAEIDTGARDDLLRAQASWRILVGMVFELHTFFCES